MRRLTLRLFRWWCAHVAQWSRRYETDPSRMPVSRLRNITPRLGKLLIDIDVHSRADLVRLGSLEVYRLLLEQGNPPNHAVLLALHGAITNQGVEQISQKQKAYLLEEARTLEPQKTW
jgi:triphosphoribosyl-dephospho-CoA synthetase